MFQDYTFLTRAFIPKPVSCSYHAITKSLNAIFQTNIETKFFTFHTRLDYLFCPHCRQCSYIAKSVDDEVFSVRCDVSDRKSRCRQRMFRRGNHTNRVLITSLGLPQLKSTGSKNDEDEARKPI